MPPPSVCMLSNRTAILTYLTRVHGMCKLRLCKKIHMIYAADKLL